MPLGERVCGACGSGGLFTPGPCRKPVTPYAVRKENFLSKTDASKARKELDKMDFRKLNGTLMAAAATDATKMALQPRHRVEWADVELKTEIGEGAYALVYEGVWQERPVAVKELKLVEASDEQMNDFVTEVTVLASLSHPNVIDFVGACTDPAHLAILLEFMPTGDASILLAREDVQITWERRLSWLADVARAMQYLHSRTPQIIHRDLKTENVLISADFQTAKITDFGLSQAKAASFVSAFDLSHKEAAASPVTSPPPVPKVHVQLETSGDTGVAVGRSPHLMDSAASQMLLKIGTSSNTNLMPRKQPGKHGHTKRLSMDFRNTSSQKLRTEKLNMRHFSMEAGTPAYVAPEIWRCEHYSERVDSYSFAIVMWEFMTREWAFDGLDVDEIIEHVRDLKERPDVPQWCPRSFHTLLCECWAESPLFRPSFDTILRRIESLQLECAEWPSAPNEWPEFTREQQEQEEAAEAAVEEIIEEVIEEVVEEVLIEEEEMEEQDAAAARGGAEVSADARPDAEDARESEVLKSQKQTEDMGLSPAMMRTVGLSPIPPHMSPSVKKVSLLLSAEDMSDGNIENMLETFMERYCEAEEHGDEELEVKVTNGELTVSPQVARQTAREPANIADLAVSVLCMILAHTGSLVHVVRAFRVCRLWMRLGERPELWVMLAKVVAVDASVPLTSLGHFCAAVNGAQSFGEELSQKRPNGQVHAVFAVAKGGLALYQTVLPLVPAFLKPGVSYFEFCVTHFTAPMPQFAIGLSRRGCKSVMGVASGGSVFLTESHPSSFRPMSVSSVCGIGVEWETRQMFVTREGRLLYFEKLEWEDCAEALYPTVFSTDPRLEGRSLEMWFRFAGPGFAFDVAQHAATRMPEVAAYLRLIKQQRLT